MTDSAHDLQSPEAYAKIYDQILTRTAESLPKTRILVVSPFYLSKDENAPDAYRARVRAELKHYISAARNAAETHQAAYCDLNAKFSELLEQLTPCKLADDAVHPNRTGILYIAQTLFASLCDVGCV